MERYYIRSVAEGKRPKAGKFDFTAEGEA